jgi:hypothetical protein
MVRRRPPTFTTRLAVVLLAALSRALPAAAGEQAKAAPAPSTQAQYDEAIAAQGHGDPARAATLLYRWLAGAPPASEKYDLVQHLLAENLAALGLFHAAIVREVSVARKRTRPELLPEALRRLEEWTSRGVSDEERVFDELLLETDFGPLDPAVADWVAYEQGAFDLKNGDERWARSRFVQIADRSPFKARARMLLAATHVDDAGDDALKEFESIAGDATVAAGTRNDARISAARLRYDRGEFQQALAHYQSIDLPELDPGRGQIYLEEAWTLYRLGFGGRAMGRLAALDAPSFRGLFLPEKSLLRSFIYKDACQLLPSKIAARELTRRYRHSLELIQQRKPLTDDPVLVKAASEKGAAHRLTRRLDELRHERDTVDRYAAALAPTGLAAQLTGLYSAAIAETDRQRQLEVEKEVVVRADELLHAAEQVGLLDYEVGLALYRRDRGAEPSSPLVFESEQPGPREEAYGFDGEYWNDELDDYRFHLENLCGQGITP